MGVNKDLLEKSKSVTASVGRSFDDHTVGYRLLEKWVIGDLRARYSIESTSCSRATVLDECIDNVSPFGLN